MGDKDFREFIAVDFDGQRIRIPAHFTEQMSLSGAIAIECWWLVVTVGHYRLLTQSAAMADDYFMMVYRRWDRSASPGGNSEGTGDDQRAAMRARLIRTTASRKDSAWRVAVPAVANLLVPKADDHSFVFLMLSDGFLDLWFPDTLRRALSIPIGELLRQLPEIPPEQ